MEPFADSPIDKLCTAIWDGNDAVVAHLIHEDPTLVSKEGIVYEKKQGESRWVAIKRATPAAIAAEKGRSKYLATILSVGGIEEHHKLTRMSMIGDQWIMKPRMTESYGMHPTQMDFAVKEALTQMKNDINDGTIERNPLVEKYIHLMVDRHGSTEEAYMITTDVVLEIRHGESYRITFDPEPHLEPTGHKVEGRVSKSMENFQQRLSTLEIARESFGVRKSEMFNLQMSHFEYTPTKTKFLEVSYNWHLDERSSRCQLYDTSKNFVLVGVYSKCDI